MTVAASKLLVTYKTVDGVQALSKIQFKPPPAFVIECAAYLQGKLEAVACGQAPPTALDVGMVARLMFALVSFSFEPPPPLLSMVCIFAGLSCSVRDSFLGPFCSYGIRHSLHPADTATALENPCHG
jgi:hypothetical protein